MARQSQPTTFKHSVWDRLINPNISRGGAAGASTTGDVEQIKDSVRRDLEWLLNSRRPPHEIPAGLTSLEQSTMTYGLPDFTSMTVGDPNERDRLHRTLEQVIKNFEPRLSDVVVTFDELDQDKSRASLHYRIAAMLRLDPLPERIVFDTVLDLGNRAFIVKRDGA